MSGEVGGGRRRGSISLFRGNKNKKKRRGGAAPCGSASAPRFLSLSQNTKIITRASKYAVFEMIFSLCSGGRSVECVGIRCHCGSCRGWLRGASVSGPLRPACPGRQTRGGGNLIAQPSPSLMSVYPAIYPCVYLPRLAVGRSLSACRILLRLSAAVQSSSKTKCFLFLPFYFSSHCEWLLSEDKRRRKKKRKKKQLFMNQRRDCGINFFRVPATKPCALVPRRGRR